MTATELIALLEPLPGKARVSVDIIGIFEPTPVLVVDWKDRNCLQRLTLPVPRHPAFGSNDYGCDTPMIENKGNKR